jgi:hypothetical protein
VKALEEINAFVVRADAEARCRKSVLSKPCLLVDENCTYSSTDTTSSVKRKGMTLRYDVPPLRFFEIVVKVIRDTG